MSSFCGAHRVPRAFVDPIDSARTALAVLDLALRRPLAAETVALVLDADLRGRTIVVVDGTDQADSILDVVERVAQSIAATAASSAECRNAWNGVSAWFIPKPYHVAWKHGPPRAPIG